MKLKIEISSRYNRNSPKKLKNGQKYCFFNSLTNIYLFSDVSYNFLSGTIPRISATQVSLRHM